MPISGPEPVNSMNSCRIAGRWPVEAEKIGLFTQTLAVADPARGVKKEWGSVAEPLPSQER
jgi:hypothetical protein